MQYLHCCLQIAPNQEGMVQTGGQGHGLARVVLRAVLSPPCWAPHSPCGSPAATEAGRPMRRLPSVGGRMTAPKTPASSPQDPPLPHPKTPHFLAPKTPASSPEDPGFLTLGPVSSHSSGDLRLWTAHQLPQQGGCPG
ncbi:putative uncharacterized protein encoded by LINC00304 [Pan paniscus]|uniref:putative uncharacterized protein encoded by LINC00304 n=1 Tax=Pan paniscus TaxID=9597 RepID=UPI0004F097AB|nr:putative uncharacterized protein encoded by LINC00304 [Pan paniscus]